MVLNNPLFVARNSRSGYEIQQSLRFNSADSAYLSLTTSKTPTNAFISTTSFWVKRSAISGSSNYCVFGCSPAGTLYGEITFGNDRLQIQNIHSSGGTSQHQLISNDVFRDVSAWYHIVVMYDTTQATASNRTKVYVNNRQITSWSTETYLGQNIEPFINSGQYARGIGKLHASYNYYFGGYLAEFHHVDGQSLTPSSFGETDTITGAWIPKKYSGSYGTNGFYLKFESSGIGTDSSGNGNNWTANNFTTSGTGTDVMSDTPTTNWCTLNPLYKPATSSIVPQNGNLEIVSDSTGYDQVRIGTHAFSSGKWYWEYRMEGANNYGGAGIIDPTTTDFHDMMRSSTPSIPLTGGFKRNQNGTVSSAGVSNVSSGSISNGTVAMFAVDYNTGKVWVGTAGSWYNSGDPAAGTNPTITIQTLTTAVPFFSPTDSGSQTYYINWGQRAFEYTPPTGYKALNTANLPEPTIKKGGKYFNTVLWTGNATNPRSITGVGFSPDFVWTKKRNNSQDHFLYDAVRGSTNGNFYELRSSSTSAEGVPGTANVGMRSLDSDGFTIGSDGSVNTNNDTYVAWAWDANGAGSSNTAGTITSTVSANATAGFSIATYTGNGTVGATVGHGLGVAPKMIMVKRRDTTGNWFTYHEKIDPTIPGDYYILLNTTAARVNSGTAWNNTIPSSTVFTLGTNSSVNTNGGTYVAYCFSEVAGYSKFGSYTGNGSSDGPFLYCGFQPKFLLIKSSSSGYDWFIFDDARNSYNAVDLALFPNVSGAESGPNTYSFDFLSNGFKLRNTQLNLNGNGNTYIFAAFAEHPFKYANAR